jgi:hypothetical protein
MGRQWDKYRDKYRLQHQDQLQDNQLQDNQLQDNQLQDNQLQDNQLQDNQLKELLKVRAVEVVVEDVAGVAVKQKKVDT